MPDGHHHLTLVDRCQIYALRKSGMSYRSIGDQLGYSHTTISREIKRNSGDRGYRYKQADRRAKARRRAASSRPRKATEATWNEIKMKMERGWSPEQISGRAGLEDRPMMGRQWIYNRVRADRREGGKLYLHLRRRGKKPNWRGGAHSGRGHIPNRVGIEHRPAIVDAKARVGDIEIDTIYGKNQLGAIVTAVDRVSWYVKLALVNSRKAEPVAKALVRILKPLRHLLHTLTADNGKEFAKHMRVAKALGVLFFFADPYSSWQRGVNEHTNGLVREFIPKGTNLRKITAAELQELEDRLNNRPRKVLGYRTPAEVFHAGEPSQGAPVS